MSTPHKYGWRPDRPDHRDVRLSFASLPRPTPPRLDLRSSYPAVYDQGQLGSCTGNAIAGLCQHVMMQENQAGAFEPSRLFIYYNERAMEGTVDHDAGASIRDGLKSVASQGVCPEASWPYDVSKYTVKPPDHCYSSALQHPATAYARVNQDEASIEAAVLNMCGVVFGFTIYESFESSAVAGTGYVPMPRANESALGGHAVVIVGYDRIRKLFICRNSWGTSWGERGYFYLPYAYVLNYGLAADFWTITRVRE